MKKLLYAYKNGNYSVLLFEDGTKIRFNDLDYFDADFPENIDLCISKKCSVGCPFCHESATKDGKIADLRALAKFISKLHPGTEIALGGGALSELPNGYLGAVAEICKLANVVLNMTINQKELENEEFFNNLKDMKSSGLLIGSIGVSFVKPDWTLKDLQNVFGENLVIHTINGITKKEDYTWLVENNFKILILGYKDFGRGIAYKTQKPVYIQENQNYLEQNIKSLISKAKLVSFDNLALEQLKIKDKVSSDMWEEFFMGEDGTATMYVDAVNEQFAINSTQERSTREYFSLEEDSVDEIFQKVKELKIKRENKWPIN